MHSESSLEPLLWTSIFRPFVLYIIIKNNEVIRLVTTHHGVNALGRCRQTEPQWRLPAGHHVGHRLVSDEIANRQNARVTACNAFNDAVEEPCLCDGVGLRRQWWLSGVVIFNSSRPEYQHSRGFDGPKKIVMSWVPRFLGKWCSSRPSRVQNSARLLAREDADARTEEHLALLLFEHVSLWLLTAGCLQREDQCCHPRHHRSSEDEHQEAIEVEHAGGGQGDMCSVQRPIRPDECGLLGLYRMKSDLRYTWMRVQKISPISLILAVIWHEKERHWKVPIYLPTPVHTPLLLLLHSCLSL